MKRSLLWITAMLAVLVLTSCPTPFDLTGQLKGETLTYTFSNGGIKAVSTIVFDSTGEAGTYEMSISEYGYPSQAALDSNDYTQQTWFRTGGYRGTFTYDNDTYLLTSSKTDVWALKDDVTTNFEADYAYRTLASTFGDDCTAASEVDSMEIVFNQDNAVTVLVASGSSYVAHYTTTTSQTIAGVTSTETATETTTWTLGAATATKAYENVTVNTMTGMDDVTITYRENSDYNVTNLFAVGSTADNETFEKIWKDGKTVSFGLGRTRYTEVCYEGSTAPSAPTVDPATGIGGTHGGPLPYYYINAIPQESDIVTFTKQKEYIVDPESLAYASRSIK